MGRRGLLLAAFAAVVLGALAYWQADRPARAPTRVVEGAPPPVEEADAPREAPAEEAAPERFVFGRVVDAGNGAPVAGASVLVFPSGADGPTDEQGKFEIAGTHGEAVRCAARAPGLGVALGPWLRFGDGERLDAGTFRIAKGLRLAGRVVDPAGAGIASAEVQITREGAPSEEWAALLGQFGWQETEEEGRFVFEGLDDGLFRISVSVYDAETDDVSRWTVEHVRAGGDEILITFPFTRQPLEGTIAVTVTLPDGRPLPRGTLYVGAAGYSGADEILDGEGSMEIDAAGSAWLAVVYPMDTSGTRLPLRGAFRTGVTPREEPYAIVLEPGEAIEGIVTTTDGLPLPATVTLDPRRLDGAPALLNQAHMAEQAVSGADGRFGCFNLAPGEYALHATHAGYVGVSPYVVARTGARDVRIEMRRAGKIRLRFVAPEGDLVGGGSFTLLVPGPSGYTEGGTSTVSVGRNSRSPTVETGFDGLREGEVYRVRASVGRRGFGRYAHVEVDAVAGDGEPVEVPLRLGRKLAGRVLRKEGAPVVAAEIRVRVPLTLGKDEIEHYGADKGQAYAVSGFDGRFELRGVPEGPFWLTCTATGLAQTGGPAAVPAQEKEIEIRMEPGQEVSGRIVGDPPLDFRIDWIPTDLAGAAAAVPREFEWSGADGFFALRGIPKGTLRLDGWRPRAEDDDRYVQADGVQAGAADLRLRALEGSRIAGTVRDRDGRPVFFAAVVTDAPWGSRRATTDEKGRFVLRALPPGRHTLRVVTAQGPGPPVSADAPGPPLDLTR